MSTLEKMKPNQLEAVQNQVSEYKGVDVPTEINSHEKGLFHALMINSTPAPPTGWNHVARVQMFDEKSWEVNKNNFARLGYSQVFILHDPIQLRKEEKANKKSESDKPKKADYFFLKSKAAELGYEGSQKEVDLLAFFESKGMTQEQLLEEQLKEEK